jgi:hypothetical protein
MVTRIMVTLEGNEPAALATMARKALRDPREQLRFLLRQEAQALGLLPDERVIGAQKKAAIKSDEQTRDDQDFSLATES